MTTSSPIKPELLDQLLANYTEPEDLTGQVGLFKQLKKALIERALGAELCCTGSPLGAHQPKEADANALERGQLRMDPERGKAEAVTLTVTEFLILKASAIRPRGGQEPQRSHGCGPRRSNLC
jgi:hypothetical protein